MRARLWQFIVGYVKIRIEGLKLVQFVNDAAARGIELRQTNREGYSKITAETSWRDYKKLLALASNRPLRVIATVNRGMPHIIALAVKRVAFTLGLAVCIAALIAVNGFVLDIRVTGCTTPGLERRVIEVLESQGFRPGAMKSSTDLHRCETALMLQLGQISFAAIRVNGVVATVSIVEGVPAPEILDKSTPCSIVASRDAVVRKLVVYEGRPVVQAGDSVRQGQMLVDGAEVFGESMRLLHARAEVMASVWYEGSGSAPLFTQSVRRTGKTAERRELRFAGYSLPAGPAGEPGFACYETESRAYYVLGAALKGPVLVVTTYHEAVALSQANAFEEAKRSAFLSAVNDAQIKIPQGAQTLDSRTLYRYEGGGIVARVYIETLQNIAVEQRIQ